MSGQSVIESKLPVFTTPQQQITFYADDTSTYKQILTIYNPYDFLVKFRVSCTDCSKYTISVAQGSIKSNHSIDLVIHHKAVVVNNIGISDTVRIQLYATKQVRAAGKKDLSITLLANTPRERPSGHALETERFHDLEADTSVQANLRQHPFIRERNGSTQIICFIIAGMCFISLFLPEEAKDDSYLPFRLCLSNEHKLFAAFILGLSVMVAMPLLSHAQYIYKIVPCFSSSSASYAKF